MTDQEPLWDTVEEMYSEAAKLTQEAKKRSSPELVAAALQVFCCAEICRRLDRISTQLDEVLQEPR